MSNIGPISLEGENNETVSNRIDAEVCNIVNHCEEVAKEIILNNRVVIDLAVEKLLDAETLDGEEFRELVSSYTILPKNN